MLASADPALFVDENERVIAVNPPARALFGYEDDRPLGLERGALVVADDPRLGAALELCARVGKVRACLSLRLSDGTVFDATVSVVRVDDRGQSCWSIHERTGASHGSEANEDLRDSNELLRALSDAAFEAVFMHSQGVIRVANRAAELCSGVGPGELIGRSLADFIAPESLDMTMAKVAAKDDRPYEALALRADGTIYPVEVHARSTPVDLGEGLLRVVAMRDVSSRRALEQQLRQAQKLDAIGRLAAGVAHDFNNLLAVITSSAELILLELGEEAGTHRSRADLDDLLDASARAAKLVQQLLAFGRQSSLQPEVVDAGELLAGLGPLLERMVGSGASLELCVSEEPTRVRVDPVQFEQVVTNLVVNARDAVANSPTPGHVSVSVESVCLDQTFADEHVGVSSGPHVKVCVSDNGVGMDADTHNQLFEPFFTTKAECGGTGLGLATVFGIVRQSAGSIWVESEPGWGAAFTIYLPRVA